ncbi:dihydrolipoamide acetyltransferase family protein [Thermogemmata fonticola]|uniref:Dihydrolipoamide acetyltransferase component of pyruvate dehydrogenase complex n=1 Tax=Thermogemmata fonticola TaxID=2755323 RepID=A0A7V9ABY7_9BACT|nr:dihydrolipoamide acetyltransferase family protein [Thermogemmata fonticola]MBA2226237.1 2-oxo acid dehydrogenase subunit E2 [Thermogemmata fonticola]
MTDFVLPPVGEGLIEVELLRWLVQPGDQVRPGQGLAEVMSDKATMEVPAPFAGQIVELYAVPGRKVRVGERLLRYAPAESAAGVPAEGTTATAASPAAESSSVPPMSPRSSTTPAFEPLQTSSEGNGSRGPALAAAARATSVAPPAAPSVRLLARQLGLDLSRIRGSGPGGRILLEDLAPFLRRPSEAAPSSGEHRPPHPPPADTEIFDLGTPGTRLPLTGLRKRIAEHLTTAKRLIPHYSYMDECDVTDLVRLREQLKEAAAQAGIKLTYLPFLVKAVVAALREVPLVNSTFDEAAAEIILHDHYHIGIAVATAAGLIVPVIKDADKKDIWTIAQDIERLSQQARSGRIHWNDLQGGTFTITSIGNIGGLMATPIVNHPQVGILGVGKIVKRPVYDEHERLRPAHLVYLSFSFDHRVVDGAVGVVFGNAVRRHLQKPAALLLSPPPAVSPTSR